MIHVFVAQEKNTKSAAGNKQGNVGFEKIYYHVSMIKVLIRVCAIAAALLLIARFVPGIAIENFYIALIVAVLWGILGVTIRPILGILALPINLLTLGLFSFVLNALLFWFLSTFIAGFYVSGFIPALEGSLMLSLVAWILHIFF